MTPRENQENEPLLEEESRGNKPFKFTPEELEQTFSNKTRIYGRNILPKAKQRSLLSLIWETYQDRISHIVIELDRKICYMSKPQFKSQKYRPHIWTQQDHRSNKLEIVLPLNHSKPSFKKIYIGRYDEDIILCPFNALQSLLPPYTPATSDTIAGWIKSVIKISSPSSSARVLSVFFLQNAGGNLATILALGNCHFDQRI
ncbi:unnamed protein product [Rhizophagus irregularis]|nr:unnamed protein product [Rhizophagus irregularis]